MSQITIDLNDSPELLGEIAAFLQHLSGGPLIAKITSPVVEDAKTLDTDKSPLLEPSDKFTVDGDTTVHTVAPPVVEAPEPSSLEGVDLDSDGLPWDYRIHGAAKKKTAKDDKWKKIRGIDPETVDQVETELRAVMLLPQAAAPTPPIVEAPPAPTEPTPPAPPVTDTKMTFPELMSAITSAGITPETVTAAVVKHGLQALPLLAARPDLIPMVAAELGL